MTISQYLIHSYSKSFIPTICHSCLQFLIHTNNISFIPPISHSYLQYLIHTSNISFIPTISHSYQQYLIHTSNISFIPTISHSYLQYLIHTNNISFIPPICHSYLQYLSERSTKQTTGLSQIINILTRDSGILDWCLTNRPKLFSPVVQLPKIGRSDHFVVMISPCDVPPLAKERSKKVINKRDLRPSRLRDFGNWITQQRWEGVLSLTDVSDKYEFFMKLMLEAVEKYLPVRKITICNSDKPWVSSKFKQLVARRQRALGHLGKDSPQFKHLRNAVLEECRNCKRVFYNSKVAKL